jgi:hypothetical protein
VPPRLIVPTDDLFAWTLTGRDALLTDPDDDPRTAASRERYALQHLLSQGRHVMALGSTVIGNLLGALPADPAPGDLHTLVEENWEPTAEHRRSLAATTIPDDDCDRRAVHTLLDAVPAHVLLHLLRWAGEDWPARRQGWPTHLSWPGEGSTGRFSDQPYLVRVVTPTTALSTPQRAVVRACQDAGLEVVLLRVNSFGDLPCPGDETLGLQVPAAPECTACRPAVDVDPPSHLLPGEWPLPPFLSPGVPEEHHDHHLRAHLARTTPTRTIGDTVAALPLEALNLEAFTLLTHPDAWRTSRDNGRRHLEPAVRRYRELVGDPHLAHEEEDRTDTFRDALTTWQDGGTLREAATAAGRFLALQGFDVLAIRDATAAVNDVLGDGPAQDPASALRLLRLLSLGFTGEELLEMDAAGTYPDEHTLDFLDVLRG